VQDNIYLHISTLIIVNILERMSRWEKQEPEQPRAMEAANIPNRAVHNL